MSVSFGDRPKVVGLKQSRRAVKDGAAVCVHLAADAEQKVAAPMLELCAELGVPVERGYTMEELGRACGIAVSAAVVALIK